MPPVLEIIKVSGKILENDIKLVEGKILINGSLEVGIIYIGEGEEEQEVKYVEYKLPFGHFIENPSILSEMEYQLSLNLKEILTQVKTNQEGIFNTIQIEGIVDIRGTLYKDYEIETIVDAYSPSVQISLKKERVNCQEMVLNQNFQTIIKENISTPIGQEDRGYTINGGFCDYYQYPKSNGPMDSGRGSRNRDTLSKIWGRKGL